MNYDITQSVISICRYTQTPELPLEHMSLLVLPWCFALSSSQPQQMAEWVHCPTVRFITLSGSHWPFTVSSYVLIGSSRLSHEVVAVFNAYVLSGVDTLFLQHWLADTGRWALCWFPCPGPCQGFRMKRKIKCGLKRWNCVFCAQL